MQIDVRVATDGEYPLVCALRDAGFAMAVPDIERTEMAALYERGRTLLASVDGVTVGTATAYSFELTVPGAVVPAAGVSEVAVAPTHRRRGVLSALMRRQLADVAAGREPIAALWASESSIYGRFGYGAASDAGHLSIRHDRSAFRPDVRTGGDLRFVYGDEVEAAVAPVYEQAAAGVPGFFARDTRWWAAVLCDTPPHRGSDSPLACVVHSGPGGDDGYVLFRRRHADDTNLVDGTVTVAELVGVDTFATASLWRFCFDLDLMVRTKAPFRMAADPLRLLLAQPRWLEALTNDGLYVRLVDIGAALEARSYVIEDDLVVSVADGVLEANSGKWLLEARVSGARCTRTDRSADLEVDVSDLGASYLGRPVLAALAGVGRVRELAPRAASRADAVFSWPVVPWCPVEF